MNIRRIIGITKIFWKRHGAKILTGAGIAGFGATTVLACKATLQIEPVVDRAKQDISAAKECADEAERAQKLRKAYVVAAKDAVKIYAPSAAVGALSTACVIGGHKMLSRENAAITAAYMALSESFNRYRQRIANSGGDGKQLDEIAMHGNPSENPEAMIEGLNRKISESKELGIYARRFDDRNPNWQDDPERRMMFLRHVQAEANRRLRLQGHLFLNEVYDLLGFDRTIAGTYVGWVDDHGKGVVHFGPGYDRFIDYIHANDVRKFSDHVMLDFNVDGVVTFLLNGNYEDVRQYAREGDDILALFLVDEHEQIHEDRKADGQ